MVVKRGIGPTRAFMDDEREHRRSGVVPPFSAILLMAPSGSQGAGTHSNLNRSKHSTNRLVLVKHSWQESNVRVAV